MRTKNLIILLSLVALQLSCEEATKTTSDDINGVFQKEVYRSGKGKSYITTYEIKSVEGLLYSLEATVIEKGSSSTNKKPRYMELEYRPKTRILYGDTGLGVMSFQFSKNFDTITEMAGSTTPLIRIK